MKKGIKDTNAIISTGSKLKSVKQVTKAKSEEKITNREETSIKMLKKNLNNK